ncbi:universal stress protein [Myxococcus sp. RHSTA-1-4]|uniref:universal stress protein n=1 Tax=Myxococcus sp. RHSTA-1-4 TaxID=2874601 RepID=UPI001CBAD51A|nr:universal stress protein [Myxococcus sp. RHSTA-1-4]MBZ4416537.1 universal stress protein [Myxococcus sp. RHSTA-1-4]
MPEKLRSLLIPIDLSTGSTRVIDRAALLPLAEGARLTLLHVVPRGFSREATKRAEGDARNALEAMAKRLSRALPASCAVKQVVKVGVPADVIAGQARAARAELTVMGRGGGRAFKDIFLGSTAERVIRQGQFPVLVVRLPPHAPYRKPAVAMALDQAAHDVLASLLRVIPPPLPRVAIIHAYDAPLHGYLYPSFPTDEARDHQAHYERKALRGLSRLLAASLTRAGVPPGDAPAWKLYVRNGSPRSLIAQTVKKLSTDLLVLGTHGYSGLAHAFLGTVAGDVLREVPCDVLVVPPRPEGSKET